MTAADHDDFHPVVDHPDWTETVWFAWMVPERQLLGYFYPVFRPGLGLQSGGVLVVDGSGELPWELPAFSFGELLPLAADADLRRLERPDGLFLRCVEPGRTFDFGVTDGELTAELRFEATVPAMVTERTAPFAGAGHLDQTGRVTGSMCLAGETIEVDCFAMRDRSWGPRRFVRGLRVGYSYATASADSAFLVVASGRPGHERVRTGYLQRDGACHRIVDGSRQVRRDDAGRPVQVEVRATDTEDRSVSAIGRIVSRQVFTPYPSMLSWDSLVEWDVDGTSAWGEDQDVWHPDDWRDQRRWSA